MRQAGLSVEVLTEYMRLALIGDDTIEARRNILEEQREILEQQVANMQKTLDVLNYKIGIYEERMMEIEQNLTHDEAISVETGVSTT